MRPFEHAWRLLKEQLNEGAPPGSTLRDQVSPELLDEDGNLSQAGFDKKYGVPPLSKRVWIAKGQVSNQYILREAKMSRGCILSSN